MIISDLESTLAAIRWILLGLLLLGLVGTASELVLLEHYEEAAQLIPLVLIGLAFVTVAWHAVRPSPDSLRALQATMLLCVVAGGLGIYLHYQGSAAFQREVDPSLAGRALVWKAVRAKSPPALAPGSLSQLGLIGLVYTYRHPSRHRRRDITAPPSVGGPRAGGEQT